MASQHLEITSTASRLSADFRSLIDQARALQAQATRVKDISDQVAFGGDFAALAVKLGFSGETAAADAETVYNLLTTFASAINAASQVNNFVDRLG